jgi:hypothetical protein
MTDTADISERATPATGADIRVGPLQWRAPTQHPQDAQDADEVAEGLGGRYSFYIRPQGEIILWFAHDEFIWQPFDSVEAAKAAAQTDFETRLRAFVSVAP